MLFFKPLSFCEGFLMNWKRILKILILINGYAILGFGVYIGIFYLTGGFLGIFDFIIGILVPLIAIYLLIIYAIIIIVMIRLHNRNRKFWLVALFMGIFTMGSLILPFVGIPQTVRETDSQFQAVFQDNYMDMIPSSLKSNFRATPFNLWDLLNSPEDFDCNLTKDCGPYLTVPVYNDEFYFDYYCPTTGDGPFPTIINIHGGAWVIGNKGMGNAPQFTRYLAHQGYAVFDIQYGLHLLSQDNSFGRLTTWANQIMGRSAQNKSYTISEMAVQVLGNFTDYLVAHAVEYKVNTSCVYVMGRSAGAQLTGLFLGYNSTYKHLFNDTLKLKGLVLFYPPANMTALAQSSTSNPLFGSFFEELIGGTPENNISLYQDVSPIHLVDESAPPCLILQGKYDMLPISESYHLKEKLESLNRTAILVSFPFQGHAFDLVINSPGGQVSTYYVERFLAATQYISV
jgi:acetyl esterase/lipase